MRWRILLILTPEGETLLERAEVVRRLMETFSSKVHDENVRSLARGLEECRHCEDRCGGIAHCERFQTAARAAGDAARILWKDTIAEALALFFTDCGRYPTEEEGLAALLANPGITGWQGPYWKRQTASILDSFEYRIEPEGEPELLNR
jgi:hypothetical protein